MRANKIDFSVDYNGTSKLTFSVKDKVSAETLFLKLKDETDIDLQADKHREKRSLNANAYMWVLVGKLAKALRNDSDSVYFELLKRYGTYESISVKTEAEDYIIDAVKYCEKYGESVLNGVKWSHIKIYKGSSQYDTKEMSDLINGVVDEAQEQGIETMTPDELERIKERWVR